MDEYLSEKEQIEQIRQWWSDYGWYVLGGAAIALLGLFGYQRYQASMDASAEVASALYRELEGAVADDAVSEAERVLATLQAEHAGSPYANSGALLLARMVLVSDTDRAVEALRGVVDSANDTETAMIARLRLARVLSWREQHDEALELLAVDDAGSFAARISDIRGDILLASNDEDGARAAYTAALILPGSDSIDRTFVQMKLGSLNVAQVPVAAPTTEPDTIDLEAIEAETETETETEAEAGDEP